MLIFQLFTSYNHINNIMVVSILTDLHAMLEAPVVIKLQGFVFEGVAGLFSAKRKAPGRAIGHYRNYIKYTVMISVCLDEFFDQKLFVIRERSNNFTFSDVV